MLLRPDQTEPASSINLEEKKSGLRKNSIHFSEHRWLQCRPFRICTRASSFIFVLCRLLNVITHSCQLGMRGSVFVLPPGELVPQEVNPSPFECLSLQTFVRMEPWCTKSGRNVWSYVRVCTLVRVLGKRKLFIYSLKDNTTARLSAVH